MCKNKRFRKIKRLFSNRFYPFDNSKQNVLIKIIHCDEARKLKYYTYEANNDKFEDN